MIIVLCLPTDVDNGHVELTGIPDFQDDLVEVKKEVKVEVMEFGETQDESKTEEAESSESSQSLEEQLDSAIKAVRELPPCLPSICCYTFLNTYQG